MHYLHFNRLVFTFILSLSYVCTSCTSGPIPPPSSCTGGKVFVESLNRCEQICQSLMDCQATQICFTPKNQNHGYCKFGQCDDGVCLEGSGEDCASCPGDCGPCPLKPCGDGAIDTSAGEVCDDGNSADSDGCSAMCAVESGWICHRLCART